MARRLKPLHALSPAYRRRIERGLARGASRSQARGHPGRGESYLSWHPAARKWQPELEKGLQKMREGDSLSQAAKKIHVSPGRLRTYLEHQHVVEQRGRTWKPSRDSRLRDVEIISQGEVRVITVRGYEPAKLAGEYMADVGRYLDTNDIAYLTPYKGQTITDTHNTVYELETDPNIPYEVDFSGAPSYEDVYRILT